MFGNNRFTKIFGMILAILVIVSMIVFAMAAML